LVEIPPNVPPNNGFQGTLGHPLPAVYSYNWRLNCTTGYAADVEGIMDSAALHPATGGDGSAACSGDMLLQALVACAGVTLRAVATYCVVYQTLAQPVEIAVSG
jgi:hypothetical protein